MRSFWNAGVEDVLHRAFQGRPVETLRQTCAVNGGGDTIKSDQAQNIQKGKGFEMVP